MSEPENLILKLQRELRAEMDVRFDAQDRRFDEVDKKLESLKQAMHGESVLGRYATAEFEDRIEAIERRLDALEKGH